MELELTRAVAIEHTTQNSISDLLPTQYSGSIILVFLTINSYSHGVIITVMLSMVIAFMIEFVKTGLSLN
jgi:hypothetical protein